MGSWRRPEYGEEVLDREGRGPAYALCGVPAYVWGSQNALVLQQRGEFGRLGIECVDGVRGECSILECCEHRIVVHERSPGGIDQDGSTRDEGQAGGVEQR